MSLASARFAEEDEIAPFGNELGPEIRTEQREPKGGLESEVELVDGREEREVRGSGASTQTRLPAMRHFFSGDRGEKIVIGPLLVLGALDQGPVIFACPGKTETSEQRIQVLIVDGHERC